MSVMFILLPVALLLAGIALLVFIWAARTGQFDDLETPALRILHEDVEIAPLRTEATRSRLDVDGGDLLA
jgi:cbb3-type cytochrome oxidase maturation protein